MKNLSLAAWGLIFAGQSAFAAVPLPAPLGSALPVGIGGVVGVTAIALVIGAQIIKRRK